MLNVENVTELNLQPNKKHLSEIEEWLKQEWNETRKGFYCNWSVIAEAFEKGNLNLITENDSAVGFMAYRIYDLTAVIDIVEIEPSKRKNGLAKKLVVETLGFLKSKGVLTIELFCSPENSEPFWKRIGFFRRGILEETTTADSTCFSSPTNRRICKSDGRICN